MNQTHGEAVGLLRILTLVMRRDLSIAVRTPGQWLNPLLFFIIVITLFPLGIGPEPKTLEIIAPGVLWVSALLAMMLSLDTLFSDDFRDGTLEQLVLTGQPLSVIVLAKVLAHWLQSGLPLLMLAPLLALMMQLPTDAFGVLLLSLFLGTLTLSLIGAIGAALTLGLNHGGVLLSLLVLPLTIPVLIFGSGAVAAVTNQLEAGGQLALLAGLLALALSLAPLATAAALRVAVSGSGG